MNILIVSVVALVSNLLLGAFRTRFRKMTPMWWITIHASIPLIVPLRIWLDTPPAAIFLFIGIAVIGQWIGDRVLRCQKS